MNPSGIRVANRAGPQAQGVLNGPVASAVPQRPTWPFTVRSPEKMAASAATADKPLSGFKS